MRERLSKVSQRWLIQKILAQRPHVEADRVGYVENVPGETHRLRLADRPQLGQTHVHAEVTRTAEIITFAGFAGIGKAKRAGSGRSSLKHIRIAIAVDESAGAGSGSQQHRPAVLLVIGWESVSRNAKGIAAGPASQTGDLPTASNPIYHSTGASAP